MEDIPFPYDGSLEEKQAWYRQIKATAQYDEEDMLKDRASIAEQFIELAAIYGSVENGLDVESSFQQF